MEDTTKRASLDLTLRSEFVYVTTLDNGFPETRVMFNLLKHRDKALSSGPAKVAKEFASFIATNTSSRKVAQMNSDDRVCLYYSDNTRYEGLMIRGRVREVTDSAVRAAVWTSKWDMYYYGGLDGGDFSLFEFIPESCRYYHGLKVTAFDA